MKNVEVKIYPDSPNRTICYTYSDLEVLQKSHTAVLESAVREIRDAIVEQFLSEHKEELLKLIKPSDVVAAIKEKVGEQVAANVLKPSWFGK